MYQPGLTTLTVSNPLLFAYSPTACFTVLSQCGYSKWKGREDGILSKALLGTAPPVVSEAEAIPLYTK
jgi:hypothetical protein